MAQRIIKVEKRNKGWVVIEGFKIIWWTTSKKKADDFVNDYIDNRVKIKIVKRY